MLTNDKINGIKQKVAEKFRYKSWDDIHMKIGQPDMISFEDEVFFEIRKYVNSVFNDLSDQYNTVINDLQKEKDKCQTLRDQKYNLSKELGIARDELMKLDPKFKDNQGNQVYPK